MIAERPSDHSLMRRTDSRNLQAPVQQEHVELQLESTVRQRGYRIGNTAPLQPKRGDE